MEIKMKRKIAELSDNTNVLSISTHILQIAPTILAIGSFCKAPSDPFGDSAPMMHLIYGNFLDPYDNLMIHGFNMNLKTHRLSLDRPPIFRFTYIKER